MDCVFSGSLLVVFSLFSYAVCFLEQINSLYLSLITTCSLFLPGKSLTNALAGVRNSTRIRNICRVLIYLFQRLESLLRYTYSTQSELGELDDALMGLEIRSAVRRSVRKISHLYRVGQKSGATDS